MNVRAAIFDVYGTLLQVGPPPADADARWQKVFRDTFGGDGAPGRLEFSVECGKAIAQRHAAARARGIAYPEILWPSVVAEVLPEFSRLDRDAQEDFLFRHIQTGHAVRLNPGAAETLQFFAGHGCRLGIASNAQDYSIRELKEGLAEAGLDLRLFDTDLCFWSFQHGFSKPDPHVFQILITRLEARAISAGETAMIGDHMEKDIEPARAHGWQTWRLTTEASASGVHEGNWEQLRHRLGQACRQP